MTGAVVIVALAVIFVPMLFEEKSLAPPPMQGSIPSPPEFAEPLGEPPAFDLDATAAGGDPRGPVESQPLPLPPPSGAGAAVPGGTSDDASSQPGQIDRSSDEPKPTAVARATSDLPEPRRANDGLPSWVVQVASLGTSEGAADLESRLRDAGFSAFVEKAQVRGKLYYRVRVGPEADRANAERTAAMLRQTQKLDTLIQRYP